ncbi:unnamed protein product [Heligmosomoides polygyrus]|uniref:Tub domain-containing protein n=1 Tax=Heligmosomoides polygyrus TaxID=6339 RepID=A0A183G3R0_HELPZ|nr:unnamed protein product [Heligmosomoides polygyrus]
MPVNLIAFPLRPYAHFPEARSCLHQQDAIADEGVASESERNREEGARSCLAFRDVHWKELTGLTFQVGSGDVRGEVRQLMRTLEEMKCALGEGPAPKSSAAIPILTMHNKTPFWNEHNQVYQLDFGGRVTQESAKNFQVEMDGKQVLQFGRIEGGAYTLDFRRPFSAAQAFAVALASITQRLK